VALPGAGPFRAIARDDASLVAAVTLVALAAGAYLGGRTVLAIYAVSFWHYYLYWLGYFFGTVPLRVFKRDALALKGAALAALGAAYFAAPLDPASLVVVACGFLLNAAGAAALGSDRTYYGREIAGLPPLRVTAFPYSVVPHPMLLGNVAAYGGTLLNPQFRAEWWPLACAHVALNLGLLAMEVVLTPRRLGSPPAPAGGASRVRRPCSAPVAALAVGTGAAAGVALARGAGDAGTLVPAAFGAAVPAFALLLYCCYTARLSSARLTTETETAHE
jgi:hypothetical protein